MSDRTLSLLELDPKFDPATPNMAPVLLRGGRALALEKCRDRFSLSLAVGESSDQVAGQSLGQSLADLVGLSSGTAIQTVQILPNLIEVQAQPDSLEALMQAARQSPQVAFASHIYQMQQSPGTLLYLTDQVTLQFAPTATTERIQTLSAWAGLRILKLIAGLPRTFVFQVATATINPLKLTQWLIQQPEVQLAEPNVAVMRQAFYRPRESGYAQQWYLHHDGGEALAPASHIFAEAAWNLTRGSRAIAVAVVDNGVDLNHPDFQSEGKIVAPLDLQDGGFLPMPRAQPDSLEPVDHGTHCARIAVADETGKGTIGVAPGCALMPIRLGDFFDDQTIEQICHWVIQQGADVVCCAWGAAAIYFPLSLRQRVALSQAATEGREGRGAVILFAAGNANRPVDGVVTEAQTVPNSGLEGSTHWLNGFAVHPDVVTVAACTSLNRKAAASNWGESISVAAPSGQTSPTFCTQLTGSQTTAPTLPHGLPPVRPIELSASGTTNQAGDMDSGDTSAACAIVAGVAALMLSINPDLTAQQVQQILEQTADKILDRTPDAQLGLNLGSYDANRHSAWFGYGKVSAVKAVQLAQQQLKPLLLPYRWVEYLNADAVDIPDGNPDGITSALQVQETELIRDLEVSLEIQHEFLGDLTLGLLPPWGEQILLQSRSLGRLSSLKTIYSLETTQGLKMALNRSARGEWRLRIIDAVPFSRGKLQRWQLNLGL